MRKEEKGRTTKKKEDEKKKKKKDDEEARCSSNWVIHDLTPKKIQIQNFRIFHLEFAGGC